MRGGDERSVGQAHRGIWIGGRTWGVEKTVQRLRSSHGSFLFHSVALSHMAPAWRGYGPGRLKTLCSLGPRIKCCYFMCVKLNFFLDPISWTKKKADEQVMNVFCSVCFSMAMETVSPANARETKVLTILMMHLTISTAEKASLDQFPSSKYTSHKSQLQNCFIY